jgi:hypothetical protein
MPSFAAPFSPHRHLTATSNTIFAAPLLSCFAISEPGTRSVAPCHGASPIEGRSELSTHSVNDKGLCEAGEHGSESSNAHSALTLEDLGQLLIDRGQNRECLGSLKSAVSAGCGCVHVTNFTNPTRQRTAHRPQWPLFCLKLRFWLQVRSSATFKGGGPKGVTFGVDRA